MAANIQLTWQTGLVLEAAPVARDVQRIVLEPARPQPAPPGSHIDVELPGPRGRTLRRSYSVVRSEGGGRRLTVSVQLARASRGGSRAMHALRPGDTLRCSQPVQNFPLGVGASRYVLVAGGIGITALLAMGESLKRRGADYTFVVVGRSREVMAYLDELVEAHGDRLRVHVDDEGTGFDTGAIVGEVASSPRPEDTELYMCGPIRLMDALRRDWTAHDLPATNLRFETFGSSGAWAPEEFMVRIPRLDREVTVDRDTSLLDALEAAGVDVMWDCRKGECGLCMLRVLETSGRMDHCDVFLSADQKDDGRTLCACVSRVARAADAATSSAGRSEGPASVTIDIP